MKVLDVYVSKHCLGHDEALRLAGEIEGDLPDLQVKVTVLDEVTDGNLPSIPATPAYYLNGHLLFLGNPELQELVNRITPLDGHEGDDHE